MPADPHAAGNVLPEITREEHDHGLYAKRVSLVSAATIYVIADIAAGESVAINSNVTLNPSPNYIGLVTVANIVSASFGGNVTLNPSPNFIGLTTVVQASSARTITGNVTLSNPNTYIGLTTATLGIGTQFIGLTTVVQASSVRSIVGNVTVQAVDLDIRNLSSTQDNVAIIGNMTVQAVDLDIRNLSAAQDNVALIGNVTLSDAKTYIGLATATLGAGTQFVGLVTVVQSSAVRSLVGNVTVQAVDLDIRNLSSSQDNIAIVGNVTLSNPNTYIGLTTTTLGVGTSFVGLVTVVQSSAARTITGNVTLSDSKTFVGLVTAWVRSAGTTKTLIPLPITLSTSSVATIAVPSNLFKVTHLLLNSDATVRVSIKSGVTYLTGNATLGITLNPGGGWVENGSDSSPVYIGLAGAAGLVVEKFDMTGTKANIGGKVIYFDEA